MGWLAVNNPFDFGANPDQYPDAWIFQRNFYHCVIVPIMASNSENIWLQCLGQLNELPWREFALCECYGCYLHNMVLCQQSTSVQLKMTTERLKEFDFENEIMEQRLHKVLSDVTVLRFPRNISLIHNVFLYNPIGVIRTTEALRSDL